MDISNKQIIEYINNHRNLEWGLSHYTDINIYNYYEVMKNGSTYIIQADITYRGWNSETEITLDKDFNIISSGCDCYFNQRNEVCGHVAAALLLFKKLDIKTFPFDLNDFLSNLPINISEKIFSDESDIDIEQHSLKAAEYQIESNLEAGRDILTILQKESNSSIKALLKQEKHKIFFEFFEEKYFETVYFTRLKIGTDQKSYVVKDISMLVNDFENENYHKYGTKMDGFIHNRDALDDFSNDALDLVSKMNYMSNQYTPEKKLLIVNDYIDEFYDLFKEKGAPYIDIQFDEIPLEFDLEFEVEDGLYKVYALEELPFYRSNKYYYDFNGYTLLRFYIKNINLYDKLVTTLESNNVMFNETEFYEFVEYLKSSFEGHINIEAEIPENKVGMDINIYADIVEDNLKIDLLAKDEHLAIRNILDENFEYPLSINAKSIKTNLVAFHDENFKGEDKLIFPLEDNMSIKLINEIIPNLSNIAQVFISDSLKNFNPARSVSASVGVRVENDLLKVDITSMDFKEDEINEILDSYKKKKKYHKLKSGEIISVYSDSIKEIDEMYELLNPSDEDNGSFSIPLYDAFKTNKIFSSFKEIQYEKENSFNKFIERFESIKIDDVKIKTKYDSILKGYQKYGVKWLLLLKEYNFSGILADDMGLGKTIQAIAFLESAYQKGANNIVICPASLMFNWQDELNKFNSDLKAICVAGDVNERKAILNDISEYDLIITTYDYLKRDVDLYRDINFEHIILDEAQYIKNHTTKAATSIKQLNGQMKIALTGTPIENSLAELWSLFDFLMPNYLYNYHYFKKHYETPIIKSNNKKAERLLKSFVEPFILRRRKHDVLKDLPQKTEKNVLIDFSKEEEKLYVAKLSQVNKDLRELLKSEQSNKIMILKMLSELRQICCEPRVLYENIDKPSSKMQNCLEIVENLKDNKQSVLIFSFFTTVLDLLEKELIDKGISYLKLTGKNSKTERKELVSEFQEGDVDVFLISLKAGGTGLNLTQAQAVIHYDPWWNLSAQNQATDRTHRIGQENEVQVFNLIMKNSIEEKILNLQEQKKNIVDVFIENSEGSISKMSTEDIIDLLERDN
ncbi:MAG: SNF2-related protein [Erysipelotrichales bacterium]